MGGEPEQVFVSDLVANINMACFVQTISRLSYMDTYSQLYRELKLVPVALKALWDARSSDWSTTNIHMVTNNDRRDLTTSARYATVFGS